MEQLEQELNKEIHIEIQKRNGRKCWTFVAGLDKITLPQNIDVKTFLENITRKFKKTFNCNVTLQKPENIFQLNGDHRQGIKEFLIKNNLVNEDQIKIHGF
jgi:translation initiation factor 1